MRIHVLCSYCSFPFITLSYTYNVKAAEQNDIDYKNIAALAVLV